MVEQAPADKAVICDTPNATPTEGDAQAMPLTSAAASEETVPASPAPGSESDVAAALNTIAPAAGPAEQAPTPLAATSNSPAQPQPDQNTCEVPQGKQEATPDMLAGAVTIHKPDANQTVNYHLADGQNYNLAFTTKDALVETQGTDLVIRFADGAVIVLEKFDEVASHNTKLIVDGCQVVSGSEYTQMAGLADSLANIAPAAGGQQAAGPQGNTAPGNSGAGFSPFVDGGLAGGLSPLGPLGATSLNYRTVDGLTPEGGPSTPLDGKPSISLTAPQAVVDETGGNGSDGTFTTPRTTNGSFSYDHGPDGAGNVKLISGPAGLTHHGELIVTTISADGLTATGTTPAGEVIFTYTINPATSTYVFTEYGSLDHPDPTDPNEALDLPFVIRVTDSDGDYVDGTAVIRVLDDAPSLVAPADATVDESAGGTLTAGGTVNFSYGGDGAGSIKLVGGPAGLTSGGVAVNVTVTDSVITGTAAGVTVFTLTLNPATGAWEYNQYAPLDHTDATDPNDVLDLGFTVRITDYDGDSVDTSVRITVLDDGPSAFSTVTSVDETGGFDTATGVLSGTFGADGPGSFTLTSVPTGLTSHGQAVTVTLSADGLTATGVAAGVTVFTLTVNPATGAYTFTQSAPLDHPDATDPNDSLNLGFGYTVTDKDGDSVSSSLNVEVLDDAPTGGAVTITGVGAGDPAATGMLPHTFGMDGAGGVKLSGSVTGLTSGGQPVTVAVTDTQAVGTLADGTVVFTFTINANGSYTYQQNLQLDGGPNFGLNYTVTDFDGDTAPGVITIDTEDGLPTAGDVKAAVDETGGFDTVSGTLTYNYGPDGAGSVKFTSAPMGLSSHGQAVTSVISADGLTITGTANGVTVYTLTLNPETGVYTFKQLAALDHPNASDANDALPLGFGFTVTDKDGDSDNGSLTVTVLDDGPTVGKVTASVDETGGFDTIKGTLNLSYGQDGAGSVVLTGGPTGLTSGGVAVVNVVGLNSTTITGMAGSVVVYTLTLNPATGAYTFTQSAPLDHANASNANDSLTLGFGVKVTDYDGDVANGSISVVVYDDGPSATTSTVTVDETGGFDTVTGSITTSFGQDGAGSVRLTSVPTGLSSAGQPVTVTLSADGLTATGVAAGVAVFTLTLNPATGAYTFTQSAQLDHPDASNPNDALNLGFGYTVTDKDGDTATSQIKVVVYDDAPVAHNDVNEVQDGGNVATGNVVTGLNGGTGAADTLSQDLANKVVQVSYNGKVVDVPATGTATIEGQYGTLKIAADGSYTYTLNPGAHGSAGSIGTMEPLVLTDAYGNSVKVTAIDTTTGVQFTVEVLSGKIDLTTFKLDLGQNGTIDFSKTVGTVDGSDPDVTKATFTADGIKIADLDNSDITVRLTVECKCGDDNIISLCGEPKVTVVDCGCGETQDKFTYVLQDGDGDKSNATLTISSDDCKPTAGDTLVKVDETGGFDTVSGSLLYSYGPDGAGSVKFSQAPAGLTSHGQAVVSTISADGLTVTGTANGVTVYTLTLNPSTGAYVFKQLAALDHPVVTNPDDVLNLGFKFTVTDSDGDAANGNLTVAVYDDGPSLGSNKAAVDETSAHDTVGARDDGIWATRDAGTPVTASGKVSFSYGQDGAGTVQITSTPSDLKHHGEAVIVTTVGNTVTAATASGVLVFTLSLDAATGAYTYKQYASLDHANSNDPNDLLTLGFGLKVTDYDGDTATGTLQVCVSDDGPCASSSCVRVDQDCLRDDCNPNTPLFTSTSALDFSYGDDGKGRIQLTSVPTGLYSNGLLVTSLLVGNLITGKTASGQTVYTLELDPATGHYTYKQYAEIDTAGCQNTTLNIGYKVVDADGDTATSNIKIEVSGDLYDPHLPPQICVSADVCVSSKSEQVVLQHDFTETRTWQSPVEGTAANKVLLGMTSDDLTIGNYTVPDGLVGGTPQHKVSIVFEGETAGFSNTLGWFIVGPNGEMNYSQIAVLNSDAFAKGGKVDLGYVAAGTEIEFFLIPNGAQLNNYTGLPAGGTYQFWAGGAPGSAGAHLATVNDAAGSIKLYYVAGSTAIEIQTAEKGIYFASHEKLNADGMEHVISGVDTAHPDQIWIGFEDRSATTTDKDYNDLMFRVEVGDACGTIVKTCADIDINVCISDPDSCALSLATVKLAVGLLGDRIDLGGDYTLSGTNVLKHGVDTGVDFVQNSDGGFTLSGNASLATYQGIISSAELHNSNGTLSGDRTITFQVTDDTGLASNVAKVSLNYADNTYDDCLVCGVKEADTDGHGDLYVYTAPGKGLCDTIYNFSKAEGDRLDLHKVLDGHTGSLDDLSNYIKVESDGCGNTVVKLDSTGSGVHFESLAVLHGVTGVTLDSMVSDGSLDVGRFLNS